jgi:cation transport ATPase
VSLFEVATLGGVALLTWFEVDPSGHPGILPTAAAIIGGSSIWKAAIDDVAARRITMAVSLTLAVAAELGLGEFSTALITTLLVRVTSILEGWAAARGFRSLARPLQQVPTDGGTPSPAAVLPIVESVKGGSLARAPIEHLADRLSRFLVAGGLAAAAVTLLTTHDARSRSKLRSRR